MFVISGLLPSVIDSIEIKKLENVVASINNGIQNENIKTNLLSKNITIKNKKLESELNNYLEEIIEIGENILTIKNGNEFLNILNLSNIENNDLSIINDNLNNYKNRLDDILIKIDDLKPNSNDKLYQKIIKNIDTLSYKNMINDLQNEINSYLLIVNYLSNSSYKIENDTLFFLKRSNYEEFNDLIGNLKLDKNKLFSYELVNDEAGPIINANDITIYEGINIDLNSIFKCIDEVDGEVNCDISGSYDKNTIGRYEINISATDKSGISSKKRVYINVIQKEKLKYYTEVIRNQNTVIVYELDDNKEYTKIAKVFPCSTGINGRTPTGIFYSIKGFDWGPLIGGVWGQYYTVITGNILFHSVPYYSMRKDDLEWEEYNKLGSFASAGCVRLSVADSKWIYDNCPNGMKIKIYDGELPDGVEKPSALKIDENSPFRGWDPTDPDVNNPWHNQGE
ncbi:MAG: L,D-transpeptidase family protein [Bacilli bacterium]|nr:L,D-transpeptidase family protein [Bacilli bacterium]